MPGIYPQGKGPPFPRAQGAGPEGTFNHPLKGRGCLTFPPPGDPPATFGQPETWTRVPGRLLDRLRRWPDRRLVTRLRADVFKGPPFPLPGPEGPSIVIRGAPHGTSSPPRPAVISPSPSPAHGGRRCRAGRRFPQLASAPCPRRPQTGPALESEAAGLHPLPTAVALPKSITGSPPPSPFPAHGGHTGCQSKPRRLPALSRA